MGFSLFSVPAKSGVENIMEAPLCMALSSSCGCYQAQSACKLFVCVFVFACL